MEGRFGGREARRVSQDSVQAQQNSGLFLGGGIGNQKWADWCDPLEAEPTGLADEAHEGEGRSEESRHIPTFGV